MKVAFQGERGAYGEEAALQSLGGVETLPRATFGGALDSVADGRAERAVIPLENVIEGSVGEANDALRERCGALRIAGETHLRVRHCLIGNTDDISRVDIVYSHPQALGQCRKFISGYRTVSAPDTAGGVRMITEMGSDGVAGIAGRRAAEIYGRTVLATDIGDIHHNHTRFAVVARRGAAPPRRDKASVAFTLPHAPGSLHRALGALARVNLTRLESRSDRTGEWAYVFFADYAGPAGALDAATDGLRDMCEAVDVLGTYRAARFGSGPEGRPDVGDGAGEP